MSKKIDTIQDLIYHIMNFGSVDDILNSYITSAEKGIIFERLYDIVIKFGFCNIFPDSEYEHLIGNVNTAKLKTLQSINEYINQKVFTGNSAGCSDITLRKKDGTYIFISSKISKDKSVKSYDIQDIVANAITHKDIYQKYSIFLAVLDRKKVLDKVKNANKSSKYITDHMGEENILDIKDLNRYFLAFKADIFENKDRDWNDIYLSGKDRLKLRFHQDLIVRKTCDLIGTGNRSFLWGCKPRSGKTYMVGGIILDLSKLITKMNILIITPVPTETIPQFTEELFHKFKDFNNMKIHHIKGSKSVKTGSSNIFCRQKTVIADGYNIFIMSKQFLQGYIDDKTLIFIKDLKLDLIIFDENHFSGTTDISTRILHSYRSKDTVTIYLTATYNKSLQKWGIIPECQMYWDIEDEQLCKSVIVDECNIEKIKKRHNTNTDYVTQIINEHVKLGRSLTDIFREYEKFPILYLMTNMFDPERYEIIKRNIMSSKYGFSFNVLFSLNNSMEFNYKKEVKTVLRYISGSEKEIDYKEGDISIFTRINNTCSRPLFTQLWFLPSDNINDISNNLKSLMLEDKILRNYNIVCINRKNTDIAKDVKDEIVKQESIAKFQGKNGLILLAGTMLNLGITLPNCDVVILLNDTLSSDKVMQQMYRCMTEGDSKRFGFVVDLNIHRVLNTCSTYFTYKNDNIEAKLKYIIKNHLINIDTDMMVNKKIDSDTIIKKLLDTWKTDPINSFKILLKNLENECVVFDNPMQKLINKYFTSSNDDKMNLLVVLKDEKDDLQELPSGREKIAEESDSESDSDNDSDKKEEEEENIKVSFTRDVLPFIIPLVCILDLPNGGDNFINMLNNIKKDKELLDIFNDQCFIWWNNPDLIGIISDIMEKYSDKISVDNISIQIKLSLSCLLDDKEKLVELITDCLKPKIVEKRKFGEVFTPMGFINDKMLKSIEDYWKEKHDEDIWTNENVTWYDPAAGMGNFHIAIYYKLFDGLKDKIPSKKKRKKHIIEKQLFFGELNKKNCHIISQLFNPNNKYKLNLYRGDTLTIELPKIFNLDKFDIIIGNPPYNEELTSTGAKPLYNKFIEYYVDKCNMLSFIVPSRWFAGGKGLDKFREMMLNRTDILYIKHEPDASIIFGNTVNIEGGVNYFLIDKEHDGLCDFNGTKVKFSDYDIILDNKYYSIVNRLMKYDKLTDLYLGRYFGIESNDKRLTDDNTSIKCYVSQQKGFVKYIDKKTIKKEYNFYKIITARANGKNGCFGNTFIGDKKEVHTGSYISFKVKNKDDATSLLSYMKCKLPNFMVSLRKISQDISSSTCKWIPLPPLDREWTDDEVYKYFDLSNDEIKLVQDTKIKGYKDLAENINTIKVGRIQYYLIGCKVYKIKKDKSRGDFIGVCIDDLIIEGVEEDDIFR